MIMLLHKTMGCKAVVISRKLMWQEENLKGNSPLGKIKYTRLFPKHSDEANCQLCPMFHTCSVYTMTDVSISLSRLAEA